ncbi:MAG: HlyD family type I secretion periplasmic adaptor subunit [Bilophila sp.]
MVSAGIQRLKALFSKTPPASGETLTPTELPYVNEVDAALVRQPKGSARLLSLMVCALLLSLLVWSSLANIDEVTHAEGHVVASQRTQAIQNLEGGIVRAILVREGQIVEKNTPLAQLDNELAESSYREAVSRSQEHQAALIRLEAELAGTAPVFPDKLRQSTPQMVEDQLAAYEARLSQRKAEIEVLESQFQQRERDVQELISRKRQLDRSLAIAVEQRNIAYPLMQRKNYSRVEFLGLEQKVVQLQGDVEGLAATIPRAQSAEQEAKQRISFRKAELDAAITEEVNKRRNELTSLKETLAAGSDRVTRTELRSPVRGTVKQIYVHTVGGVVKPGESIMDVVPLDDSLLVEARVRPADVAFLHPGQKAMVKISAYDFSVYGGLEATLEHISADTIEDKRGDFFYQVRLRTKKKSMVYQKEELPIIPGMMATVDILTGKKTVLDYILKPILKARQNALRER